MKKVVLTKGLPASGKSTWAKALVSGDLGPKDKGAWVRVNKDDLRAMLHNGKWSKANEKFVLATRDHIILEALKDGKHVVVDDTNLHHRHFERISQLVRGHATVSYNDSFLSVSLEECIKRDLARPNSVGEKVIRRMHNQFLAQPAAKPEYDPNLPDCIICDMDGTLALLNGRSPYDASSCDQDLPNQAVIDAVLALLSREEDSEGEPPHLIIFSGRQATEGVFGKTQDWVDSKVTGEYSTEIRLRAEGDIRKDAIVKREMYETFVKGLYNVRCVFDDRNQVVDLWRSLGLTCFQVADGDF